MAWHIDYYLPNGMVIHDKNIYRTKRQAITAHKRQEHRIKGRHRTSIRYLRSWR